MSLSRVGWITWLMRSVAAAHLTAVFAESVLAGLFVTGSVDMLTWHNTIAMATQALSFLQLVAAILVWRPGRGVRWPIWASVALVVAEVVQVGFGESRLVAPHIPLGVAIFGGSAVVTVLLWAPARKEAPA